MCLLVPELAFDNLVDNVKGAQHRNKTSPLLLEEGLGIRRLAKQVRLQRLHFI